MKNANQDDLRQFAVQIIEDLTNGFIDTTLRLEVALLARHKGLRLDLDQAAEVLRLLEDALLYVCWPGDPGGGGVEYVQEAAA